MRETFESLGQLLGYYQYLKFNITSMSAIMPQKDFEAGHQYSAIASQSSKEEKFAFIADVENFPKHYFNQQKGFVKIPCDCLVEIFNYAHCPDISRFRERSWGYVALHFRKEIIRGNNIPRRLKYKSNLFTIAKDMWTQCDAYFRQKKWILPFDSE